MAKTAYKTYKQDPKSAERTAAFRQMAALLDGEIKAGKHTEPLAKTQTEAPGLERYSLLNRLLILKQCPHVTEVHGYQEWRQYGFQVRKGEESIGICAPRTKKGEDGEEKVTGFHRASVFDRSQVDPITEQQPEEAAYVRSLGENEDFE